MSTIRTHVYLTERQRRGLDERRRRDGKSMAAVISEAIDAYLSEPSADLDAALAETFGALPGLGVSSRNEWRRREPRFG